MMRWNRQLLGGVTLAVLLPAGAFATTLTSGHSNYRIDPNVTGAFSGQGHSQNNAYGLTDIGGEAAAGFGSSPSYRLGAGYTAQLSQSIQLAVLPHGITSYYPLDTGVGVQAYDSGSGAHDGVLQNGPAWSAGKIGGDLTFNGSSQYVSTSAQFADPTAFSLELWFKTDTDTGGRLLGFGDAITGVSVSADRMIYMTDAGNIAFGANQATHKTVTSSGTYKNNAWHHVAATFGSGGGMHLYVDGDPEGSDPNTTAGSYSGYWRLAFDTLTGWPDAPTSNYFAGHLDEVKIFDHELTSTQVADEYAAGYAGIVSAQTIPQITPGISQTSLTDALVWTDAAGYTLAINQDHDLTHTDAETTINPIGYPSPPTISSPATWSEGTTGLGFTLTAATQRDGKWGTNPDYNYAAIPGAATSFHSRTGFLGGVPELSTVQFRLDVAPEQKSGKYSNQATFTATEIP